MLMKRGRVYCGTYTILSKGSKSGVLNEGFGEVVWILKIEVVESG